MIIGEVVKEVLEKRGKSVTWLALQLPCERSNVYNIFKRDNIGIDLWWKLSETLEYNFFQALADDFQSQFVGKDK